MPQSQTMIRGPIETGTSPASAAMETTEGGTTPESGTTPEAGGICTTTIAELVPPASDSGASDAAATDATVADASGSDSAAEGSASDASDEATVVEAAAPLQPELLFGFDNGADLGWGANPTANTTLSVGASLTDGHSCPGAVSLYATYAAYGPNPLLSFNYGGNGGGSVDWSGRTKLHMWVKVLTTNYSTVAYVQAFVSANGYVFMSGGGFNGTQLSDGAWHESIFNIPPVPANPNPEGGAVFDPAFVNAFGAQIGTQSAAADGGPSVPPPTTLLVDDIWLE